MQDSDRKMTGVISTRVGYSGGDVRNATISQPRHARRKRSRSSFDPRLLSYRQASRVLFSDPRSVDAQPSGQRRRMSYRSAIFYSSPEQERMARDTIVDGDASGIWPGKAVREMQAPSRADEFRCNVG